jgi:hypothetical protein
MKSLLGIKNRNNLIFFFICILTINHINSLKGKNNQFDYNFSVIYNILIILI